MLGCMDVSDDSPWDSKYETRQIEQAVQLFRTGRRRRALRLCNRIIESNSQYMSTATTLAYWIENPGTLRFNQPSAHDACIQGKVFVFEPPTGSSEAGQTSSRLSHQLHKITPANLASESFVQRCFADFRSWRTTRNCNVAGWLGWLCVLSGRGRIQTLPPIQTGRSAAFTPLHRSEARSSMLSSVPVGY